MLLVLDGQKVTKRIKKQLSAISRGIKKQVDSYNNSKFQTTLNLPKELSVEGIFNPEQSIYQSIEVRKSFYKKNYTFIK